MQEQIDEYLNYCEVVRGMSETTLRQKRSVLLRFVSVTGVNTVGGVDNACFDIWMRRNNDCEASSINAYNSVVISFLKYCRTLGVAVPVRFEMVGRLKEHKTRRKYYTREEVGRAVALAGEVDGLMIRMMFETGMRVAELVRLRLSNFDGRKICFIGKGNKSREVYISEDTLEAVQRYADKYDIRDYLWCVDAGLMTLDGRPLTVNTIRVHMQKAFVRAGFEGFYPHALRHSFATDLQRRGASVAEIKEMMGHENIATTERYMHGFDGRMKELFDKYR